MARPRKPSIKLPPHVNAVHAGGREYYYVHVGRGTPAAYKPVRLPDDPSTPEFWAAYRAAVNALEPRSDPTSVRALIAAYTGSPEWHQLGEATRTNWIIHHRRIIEIWGDLDVAGIQPKHVLALRDRFADRPAAANNMLRCLSTLLAWSAPRGWRSDNPCREVRKLKGGEGYAPWPWRAIEMFKAHARLDLWLAAAMALYSGQRQADVLGLRWVQLEAGMIAVRQHKTGKELWIPIHRDLAVVLRTIPREHETICINSRGKPWTPDGFRVAWRDDLARPELQLIRDAGLVFHGLRKSAVVMLLEAGATEAEVMAVTGQSREMVAHYARQLNQRRLAVSAILKWEADDPAARGKNEGLQNSRNVFAKPSTQNKTDPLQSFEINQETGAGEGNRTLDTQLGKLEKNGKKS